MGWRLECRRTRERAFRERDERIWYARAGGLGCHTRSSCRATNLVGTGDEVPRIVHITSWDCTREHLGDPTDHLGRGFERLGSGNKRCWVGTHKHSGDATKRVVMRLARYWERRRSAWVRRHVYSGGATRVLGRRYPSRGSRDPGTWLGERMARVCRPK